MFKISSFGTNTRLNTFAPLVNCVIDDALPAVVNKSNALIDRARF